MKPFRAAESDRVTARFEAGEASALSELADQLVDRLRAGDDPSLSRLFPDAYPDDAEASAEFRRFTVDSLTAAKIENARSIARALSSPDRGRGRVTVELDRAAAQSWLRALTDIRLVLAEELGIEHDGDTGFSGGFSNRRRALVYAWLGYVQESLVQAL
jgi:hypothetical protein